ncbi:hypothetical protein CCMA1212_008910 [Trichoderma ghanense]|uniref:Uncharacterized protein n=1 Tax=Trichoderma ghanense TaxID=65468 RepID=A0ABY2GUG8_9HYPO
MRFRHPNQTSASDNWTNTSCPLFLPLPHLILRRHLLLRRHLRLLPGQLIVRPSAHGGSFKMTTTTRMTSQSMTPQPLTPL